MGMKDWIEKKKKALEDKLKKAEDPVAQKEIKKENAKKMADRTIKSIKLAKQGLDKYNEVSKKVEEITDATTKKAIELADQVAPIAKKIDDAATTLGEKALNAFNGAKDVVIDGAKTVAEKTSEVVGNAAEKTAEKVNEIKEDNAKKPSTGSSILDLLTPVVPDTEATKPKAKEEKPKPPQP